MPHILLTPVLFAVASAVRVGTGTGAAVTLTAHSRFGQHLSSRAQRLAKISVQKPEKGSMTEIVSSLKEIYEGVEDRQAASRDLNREREKECKSTDSNLARSVEKSEGMVSDQAADLESINAEVTGLQTSMDDIKKQMSEASASIQTSTNELKNLRSQEKASEVAGFMAMKQVDGTISAIHLRGAGTADASQKQATAAQASPLNQEVMYLQELGNKLSTMAAAAGPSNAAPSLLQTAEESHSPDGRILLLRADKKQLVNASDAAKNDFDEQEKNLLDLIRVKQNELVQLEQKLNEVQPTLADKLRQASETTRSKASAERGLARDKELKEASAKRCQLVKTGFEHQDKLRTQLASPVKIATKLLETRDLLFFLSKDLQSLKKAAPAFLQLASDANSGSAQDGDDDDLAKAMKVDDSPQVGLLQAASGATTGVVAKAVSSDSSMGPFDKVNEMIEALVTSLQDQANEDQTKNQFCLEGAATQQKETLDTKTAIDAEKSKAQWAKSSIAELDDTISFCKDEVARLGKVNEDAKAEKEAENKRAEEEKEELKISSNIMVKVGEVLDGVCELSDPQLLQRAAPQGVALLQHNHDSKWTQCEEAAKELQEAVGKSTELTQALDSYTAEFGTLTAGIQQSIGQAKGERNNDLAMAEADRATRANELAQANANGKEKQKDLKLVQESVTELADSCGPGKDTHQTRMDRRAEEISALKDALQVLNGEAVPVES